MAQRKSMSWSELRVGALVIASFFLLAVAIFFIGGETGFLTSRYSISLFFPEAEGLKAGAEVWLEGVTVGNVRTVLITSDPDPQKSVKVDLSLDSRFQDIIREDSVAQILTIGLLGDKYIGITRGSTGRRPIPADGSLQGTEPSDISRIVKGTNDILANLDTLSRQFQQITSRIDRGEGTLGKLLSDTAIYDNANSTVREAQLLISDARSGPGTIGKLMQDDALFRKINDMIGRVDTVVARIENGDGTLGKFVKDPSLYNKADQLVARMQTIVDRVERGEGTLGKLSKDQALYTELQSTVTRLGSLVKQLEEGEGSAGKLIRDPSLYNSLNQTSSEVQKLLYDFRQNPKKFLTINFKLF